MSQEEVVAGVDKPEVDERGDRGGPSAVDGIVMVEDGRQSVLFSSRCFGWCK